LAEENVRFRERLFSPLVTLGIFLGQVLDPDPSCRALRRLLELVGRRAAPMKTKGAHQRGIPERIGSGCHGIDWIALAGRCQQHCHDGAHAAGQALPGKAGQKTE
jgi:hypothetical protein